MTEDVKSKPAAKRSKPAAKSWSKRIARFFVLVIMLLLIAVWSVPLLLSSDMLRDRVVNRSIAGLGLYADTQGASFGWLHPIKVQGLRVTSPDEQVLIHVDELQLDQTWWQLLMSADDLGHVIVRKPSVRLNVDWDELKSGSFAGIPKFSAHLQDAEFTIQVPKLAEPVIDVNGLDVELRVDRDEGGAYLAVERGELFSRRTLTPEICDSLLQLLDPTLGEVAHVEGSFSLVLQRLRIPLEIDANDQLRHVEFEGTLFLHQVTTKAKTPLLRKVVGVASDIYGERSAEMIRVVEDNEIQVQLRQGRIHHDQLVLGFPDFSPDLKIYSRGSVGLDESLDLKLTIPEVFVAENPETVSPRSQLHYHVTGTLNEPEISRLSDDDTTPADNQEVET